MSKKITLQKKIVEFEQSVKQKKQDLRQREREKKIRQKGINISNIPVTLFFSLSCFFSLSVSPCLFPSSR
jgi:hypothetical protein